MATPSPFVVAAPVRLGLKILLRVVCSPEDQEVLPQTMERYLLARGVHAQPILSSPGSTTSALVLESER